MQNSEFIIGLVLGVVLLGVADFGYGQQTLLNGGAESSGSAYVISHGLGEVFTATLQGDALITQGQQQPEDDVIHVSEISYDLDAKAYPNPFSEMLTVEASGLGFDEIRLLAVDGSLVFEERSEGAMIRTVQPGELARGMYTLLLLRDGREVFVGRVVRQ